MDRKKIGYILLLLAGVVLVILGAFVIQERWGGVLIGLGAGLFGMSAAQLITQRVMERNPSLKRKIGIEKSDERNVQINNYAKAKAFDFCQFLALPFFLLLVLADVRLWVVLLAIAIYIADFAVYLWFLNKKMQDK
ncbi:MAG TPA: hypothetical protein DDW87_04000 [Firmicutes bacterium]|nr:hypothetical protein [Bacillota bacterium]